MTVKQLKQLLRAVPDNVTVILSSDEEGNSFHDLFQVSEEAMQKEGRYYEALDEGSGKINSIVLWPA
jgi:hypothetical protein